MNSTQDLILGVLGGPWVGVNGYPGIEAYVESIKRSGFTGRKIMLCWGIRPDVRATLARYGFELVDLPQPQDPFFHARMRVCDQFLQDHKQEFRYIFWLDIKDLVLQINPSMWMEENLADHSIVGATEPLPIQCEETNWLWARTILGDARAEEIKNNLVLNGGVMAGRAEAMSEFFHQTHLLCYPYGGPYPPCQISMNYVLHTMFRGDLYMPKYSEGFAACLHPFWSPWRTPSWAHLMDPHPVLDINTCTLHAGTTPNPNNSMVVFNPLWGSDRKIQLTFPSQPLDGLECVNNPEGKPFSIVHGYDRDWDVKSLFEFRYRFGGEFSLDAYRRWNEEVAKNSTSQRRGLRSIKRERIAGDSKLPHTARVFRRH